MKYMPGDLQALTGCSDCAMGRERFANPGSAVGTPIAGAAAGGATCDGCSDGRSAHGGVPDVARFAALVALLERLSASTLSFTGTAGRRRLARSPRVIPRALAIGIGAEAGCPWPATPPANETDAPAAKHAVYGSCPLVLCASHLWS
jgi:hypothetical protein